MPCLKNTRRERFAQLLARGKTAADAHEEAGYRRDDGNSSRLSKNEEITSRVQEITSERVRQEGATAAAAAERTAITTESLIKKVEAVYTKALEIGQLSAAVAAAKEIGILTGKRIERSERGAPGEFDWLEKLTIEELRLLAAGKLDVEQYRKDEDAGRSRPN